jgi:ferredoxin
MCEYCAEHGNGKKWFLNVDNYAKKITDQATAEDRQIIMDDHVQYLLNGKWPMSKHTKSMMKNMIKSKFLGKKYYEKFWESWHLGQVVSNAEAKNVLNLAGDEVVVLECLCRKMNCKEDCQSCFGLSLFGDLVKQNLNQNQFKTVSKGTAIEMMDKFEQENGWYHSVWSLKSPYLAYLCNCDDKACMGMVEKRKNRNIMHKGHYFSTTDNSKCNGCGECVTVCQFAARTMNEDNLPMVNENCHGCGVCGTKCEPGAISLKQRTS